MSQGILHRLSRLLYPMVEEVKRETATSSPRCAVQGGAAEIGAKRKRAFLSCVAPRLGFLNLLQHVCCSSLNGSFTMEQHFQRRVLNRFSRNQSSPQPLAQRSHCKEEMPNEAKYTRA